MFLAFHRHVRRTNRRLAVALAVLALGTAVAAEHAAPADHHMDGAMAVCLAIAVGVGAIVAALPVLGRLVPAPPRAPVAMLPAVVASVPVVRPRERGSPARLQVFRR
jgi:hypothetical protein